MRRKRPFLFTAPRRPHPLRLAVAAGGGLEAEPEQDRFADLRLFITVWLGGLVFFGTYLA